MKVRELLEALDATRPNELSDALKLRWINDVEGRVQCEIHKKMPQNVKFVVSEEDTLTLYPND